MCNGINDPGGPRRCPSQRGDRRRDYRRALYAAQKAAATQNPTGPDVDALAPAMLPSDDDVAEATAAVAAAWSAYQTMETAENAQRYESAVRCVGALMATQIDHQVANELDATEITHIESQREQLDADIDALSRDQKAYAERLHTLSGKVRYMSSEERGEAQQEINTRHSELHQRAALLSARRRELEDAMMRRGTKEGQIASATLARYRPYGTSTTQIHPTSSARAHTLIAQASQSFPDSWMEAASRGLPMVVKESSARAFYNSRSRLSINEINEFDYSDDPSEEQSWRTRKEMPATPDKNPHDRVAELGYPRGTAKWVPVRDEDKRWRWKLRLTDNRTQILSEMRVPNSKSSPESSHRTSVHELSHRVEAHQPSLPVACIAFRERRTTSPDGTRHPVERYAKGEYVRPDDFVTSYVGKDYESSVHTEVLSMGMESVFAGSRGSLKGYFGHKPDPEHRNLILGLCASV